MATSEVLKAYDKLRVKYVFLLEKLGVLNEKVCQSNVSIKELQKIIDDTINEVTMKFPN